MRTDKPAEAMSKVEQTLQSHKNNLSPRTSSYPHATCLLVTTISFQSNIGANHQPILGLPKTYIQAIPNYASTIRTTVEGVRKRNHALSGEIGCSELKPFITMGKPCTRSPQVRDRNTLVQCRLEGSQHGHNFYLVCDAGVRIYM